MSIALLKTFIAIADRGSFSAAAEAINVSQAAVGQQMKRLEVTLNVSVFDRSQKTPLINALGWTLLPKVREVVNAYDSLLVDVHGDSQLHGELTLGAVPSTIRALVPLSIQKLISLYPQLHVRVVPGLSSDMQEQVERGAVDCAIASEPSIVGPNLLWQPFVEEELVLLTAAGVTVTDPMEILASMPFIRHTRRAAVGLLADRWLAKHQVSVRASMELESLESLTSMVLHNLGVSIVPNVCVPDTIFSTLRKIPLPKPTEVRTLGVLSRSDSSKVRLVDILLAQLEDTVKQHQLTFSIE